MGGVKVRTSSIADMLLPSTELTSISVRVRWLLWIEARAILQPSLLSQSLVGCPTMRLNICVRACLDRATSIWRKDMTGRVVQVAVTSDGRIIELAR